MKDRNIILDSQIILFCLLQTLETVLVMLYISIASSVEA